MKTRDLTPSERALVDAAWEEYLDTVAESSHKYAKATTTLSQP